MYKTDSKSVAHCAAITISAQSGMGRIALHWQEAFMRKNWIFRHYGTDSVPMPRLKALWPLNAKHKWKDDNIQPSFFLAHEPCANTFLQTGIPTILYSHGIEVREKQLFSIDEKFTASRSELHKILMSPFWRWKNKQCELALKNCQLLLLSNEEDRDFAISHYGRDPQDIFVFRNGVEQSELHSHQLPQGTPTILFYGSWLQRKGKALLVEAAIRLASQGYTIRWLLVGTGLPKKEVLEDWPSSLHRLVEVIQKVRADENDSIYSNASLFALPSYFEGQPLTLLQAMESGRCVITTRCCGQKDIINHDKNGLLFNPGDVNEMTRLIAMALNDHDLRIRLGNQAKLDMKGRRWNSVADEVVTRCLQLLDERSVD